MRAWVEFQCLRCEHEIHRLAFEVIRYRNFHQHYLCFQGWQPKKANICIHNHAVQVSRGIKKRRATWRRKRKLRSVVYSDLDTTVPMIVKALKEYILQYYSPDPDTLKIEVDLK